MSETQPKYKKGEIVYYISKAEILEVYNEPSNSPYYQIKILGSNREINTIEKRLKKRKKE